MTYFHCFFRTIDGVLLQENFIYIEFEVARKDQKHKIISYTPSVNIANMETKHSLLNFDDPIGIDAIPRISRL